MPCNSASGMPSLAMFSAAIVFNEAESDKFERDMVAKKQKRQVTAQIQSGARLSESQINHAYVSLGLAMSLGNSIATITLIICVCPNLLCKTDDKNDGCTYVLQYGSCKKPLMFINSHRWKGHNEPIVIIDLLQRDLLQRNMCHSNDSFHSLSALNAQTPRFDTAHRQGEGNVQYAQMRTSRKKSGSENARECRW